MIGKTNALVNGISEDKKPDITFSGNWFPWFVEFYQGKPYWEAWFFSSGTLTANKSYTCDAWGIGGGGQTNWSSGGGSTATGTAGIPNMRTNITLSGSVAVTIGAGGENTADSGNRAGGNTSLGTMLVCNGGAVPSGGSSITDSYKRYRFEDDDKSDEAGNSVTATSKTGNFYAQGGWLKINRRVTTYYTGNYACAVGAQGDGFGGGGGYFGWSSPGALVIRIPM